VKFTKILPKNTHVVRPTDELLVKAKECKAARTEVVRLMEPLVRKVASAFSKFSAFDDVYQEAMCGLLRAIQRYDPTKNVLFASYAMWWIRAEAMDRSKKDRYAVQTPQNNRSGVSISVSSLNDRFIRNDGSRYSEERGDSVSAEKLLQSNVEALPTPYDSFEDRHTSSRVRSIIDSSNLDALDRAIVYWRIAGGETLDKVGVPFGVSREAVRLREVKLKKRLPRLFESMRSAVVP